MNKKVVILGASGHGKVIADIIRASGDEVIGFLDDDLKKKPLGPISDYQKFDAEFVIGIGNADIREKFSGLDCKWYTAIHPSAVIAPSAVIGEGTVVMANVVVNAGTIIGRQCIVNTGAIVEHDNKLEDFVHVSVGAKLGGKVMVGRGTWVGIGAVVSNNINICAKCLIGAGAVVVKSITESGTYIGIPAKVEKNENTNCYKCRYWFI